MIAFCYLRSEVHFTKLPGLALHIQAGHITFKLRVAWFTCGSIAMIRALRRLAFIVVSNGSTIPPSV